MAAKRSPYDFYPTPESAFNAMYEVDKAYWGGIKWVMEPCAGDGALISYLKPLLPNAIFTANELDKSHEEKLTAAMSGSNDQIIWGDCRDISLPYDQEPDLVITNPPFSIAQEVLEHIFRNIGGKRIIMLLRLNFLASQKRKEFWQTYPPTRIYVLSKRPSFTGKGTDSQDYAWFVWDDIVYDKQIVVV